MALTFYYHPLSSFCWKALIALYENGTPFTGRIVDLGNADDRAEFQRVWPLAKFPVLHDDARHKTLPESSILIEYLQNFYPGATRFIPSDPDAALQVRLKDRFLDLYVHDSMQRIVADALRPADVKDQTGVAQWKARILEAADMLESDMGDQWIMGADFTLADCAAAPALFYANKAAPFEATHPKLNAYMARLAARPSFARVLEEAAPFMKYFPLN